MTGLHFVLFPPKYRCLPLALQNLACSCQARPQAHEQQAPLTAVILAIAVEHAGVGFAVHVLGHPRVHPPEIGGWHVLAHALPGQPSHPHNGLPLLQLALSEQRISQGLREWLMVILRLDQLANGIGLLVHDLSYSVLVGVVVPLGVIRRICTYPLDLGDDLTELVPGHEHQLMVVSQLVLEHREGFGEEHGSLIPQMLPF
eukprot:CAMPEP_0202374140 /NCGR_PEP_ID=MMETSP1127-20130417/5036_1 /ASSEMBLY_ACC=CAM_ASM_000462 /TAXON_ID=3047 /ORGANISM="Dunaliella tertiolecta, Strain CCMP1320" /LENGTH=200 /DNA_ID=CAMNT_0048971223 /DNA_START=861 /DNA_END=1464 /DNA_ORIENTATION=-